MPDVHLNYFGGSGGFLALHLLLLSNHFANELNDRLDDIICKQWQIPDHNKWKDSEIGPSNQQTAALTGSPKLFFYCNNHGQDWNLLSGIRMLVYTDLETQLELSRFKKCWLYLPNNPDYTTDINFHFRQFYNGIKDLSWPDCHSIDHSKSLPEAIQQELLTHVDYRDFLVSGHWQQWFVAKHRNHRINNDIVYDKVAAAAEYSDIVVKLQHIINTNGRALLEPLGLSVNQSHIELIEKWKTLHSDKILSMITLAVDSSQNTC